MPNALRDHIMDNLEDADTTTSPPAVGDALVWDGVNWVPGAAASNFEESQNLTDLLIIKSTPLAVYRTFTTQSNPIGLYRCAIHTHYSGGNANNTFQLQVDGTQVGLEYVHQPVSTTTTARELIYLMGYYNHTVAGTFDIELAIATGNKDITLRGVQFEVWRAS